MTVIENLSGYELDELTGLAVRENNSKRKNLIVNNYQAKHVPAVPSETLRLFDRLASQINLSEMYGRVMVIGFAETATAIAAAISAHIGDCVFLHTSRENIPPEYRVADFSEEHSHASEQFLFSKSGDDIFRGVKHIIFAEDELTTGKTILNLINVLKDKTDEDCKFSAASIINGMSEQNLNVFSERNIDVYRLVRLVNSIEDMNRELDIIPLPDHGENRICKSVRESIIHGKADPRLGCRCGEYENAVSSLIMSFMNKFSEELSDRMSIDVIGTEECMYPAVRLAEALEKKGHDVRSHSTTRSPIVPSASADYPLNERYRLHSFYNGRRTTYLYNLYPCDMTVLVTDSENIGQSAHNDIINIVKSEKLIILNWRK
ncbi:MAG: phosphoribosyltransferase domain-containing protein [Oscillospiraceae bacterium]|nr:phosphoribosyltransferase domain-containing protein [Oscillospiraceae bacterium]